MITAIFIGILILIVYIQHRQITDIFYDFNEMKSEISEMKNKIERFQEIDDAVRPMVKPMLGSKNKKKKK